MEIKVIVYDDKASILYSQERKSLLNLQGEYRSALDYLLKRTPLYSK